MSAPRLTEAQKCEILAAYLEGERSTTIAARFGVHISYPGLLAKRHGSKLRRGDDARKHMSAAKARAERRAVSR